MDQRIYQTPFRAPLQNISKSAVTKDAYVAKQDSSFKSHLQSIMHDESHLKISKHAKHRIEERNISIDSSQWKKIEEKITKAKSMGVNDSLVLMEHAALIVNAKNNTVITAMDRHEAESQIFTNINGTILLNE